MDSVWMEKYRPQTLDEVLGQPLAVERLRPLASSRNVPHLLFAGPPGSGKTTCALILSRAILGGLSDGNYLEIDSSDLTKRRTVTVTETDDDGNVSQSEKTQTMDSPLWRIKEFVSNASLDAVKFRVVFIDEVDSMSMDIQQALRRTMEVYSRNCVFILSCNHPSMIIDPIRSRCGLVRFVSIPRADISRRVAEVAGLEGVKMDPDVADGIAVAADGDIRRAMGILQAAAASAKKVTLDTVYEQIETPAASGTRHMLDLALAGDFAGARGALDSLLAEQGLTCREVLSEVSRLATDVGLDGPRSVKLLEKVGETDYRVAQTGSGPMNASNERVQIENLLVWTVNTLGSRKRRSRGRTSDATGGALIDKD